MAPPSPRLRTIVTEDSEGLTLDMPSPGNLLHMILLGLWLVAWLVGLVAMVAALVGNGTTSVGFFYIFFILATLAGWLGAGGVALYGWLWMLCGREIVTVRPAGVTVQRRIPGHSRTETYAAAKISGLKLLPHRESLFSIFGSLRIFGFGSGILSFEYGYEAVTFGEGIDPAEGAVLLERLRSRPPFAAAHSDER